jgi:hypothetical protein
MLRKIALSTVLVMGVASVAMATEDRYQSREFYMGAQTHDVAPQASGLDAFASTRRVGNAGWISQAQEDYLTGKDF